MEAQKKKVNLLQYSGKEKFRIELSEQLETKIRTFCMLSPNREWSGALFYTFKKQDNGVLIKANDMYLMDQGSGVHTEFDMNEPEITRYMVLEGIFDHCVGLIHSHNKMGVFFSGEDADTLCEHGTNMHNFVSIVVNNAGDCVARLTRQLNLTAVCTKHTVGHIESPIFNTDEVASFPFEKTENQQVNEQWIEYVDLEVSKPVISNIPDAIERFGEVTSKCSVQKSAAPTVVQTPGYIKPFYQQGKECEKQGTLFEEEEKQYDEDVPDIEELVDQETLDACRNVNWQKLGFTEWFNQLINGSPFSSYTFYISTVNSNYKKRFPEAEDFANWFEVWLDFMVSDFDWTEALPKKINIYSSEEEMLLCKLFTNIKGRGFMYEREMLETIITRLV